jgi:hypothetical protein
MFTTNPLELNGIAMGSAVRYRELDLIS